MGNMHSSGGEVELDPELNKVLENINSNNNKRLITVKCQSTNATDPDKIKEIYRAIEAKLASTTEAPNNHVLNTSEQSGGWKKNDSFKTKDGRKGKINFKRTEPHYKNKNYYNKSKIY